MKKLYPLLILIGVLCSDAVNALGGTWTWMKGNNGNEVLGTKGIPAITNTPGMQYDAINWVDLQGNFWLLESSTSSSLTPAGNLWKFEPATNMWTWVNGPGIATTSSGVFGTMGVPSALNYPSARASSATWTDNSNNLWLWGGWGFDTTGLIGYMNDLWKYDITANMWTWVGGSQAFDAQNVYGTITVPAAGNTPGGRAGVGFWMDDNNNFWLFGGESSFGTYNDMWRYDITSGLWTWMKGANTASQFGVYGTMGVENSANVPGSRFVSTHYKDSLGNFYLFAGYFDTYDKDYSDLWKYNPITNNWTWVAGENYLSANGNYQSYCTDNGSKGPMSRWDNPSPATSTCSKVFLAFGGENELLEVATNDLWLFNTQTAQWRWLSGSSTTSASGNYGVIGVPSAANMIPARQGAAQWVDNQGNLWVFSGSGNNAIPDDMWRFVPDVSCVAQPLTGSITYQLSNNLVCSGDSVLLSLQNVSQPVINPTASVAWIDSTHAYLFPTINTHYTVTGASLCRSNDSIFFDVTVTSPSQLLYQLSDSVLCDGSVATLIISGQTNAQITPAQSVIWQSATQALLKPDTNTAYQIIAQSATCGGADTANINIQVTPHAPVVFDLSDSVFCNQGNAVLSITGLTNISVSPFYADFSFIDSTDLLLNPYNNESYAVSGYSSCGSVYTDSVNIKVVTPGLINYQLDAQSICLGDSTGITVFGASNISVSPSVNTYFVNSTRIMLMPDTTTTYTVYGQSICGGYDSATFTITVAPAGGVAFTLSSNAICGGGFSTINIYGVSNIQITPAATFYYTDPVDAIGYLNPSVTTTYIISGNSACFGPVSSTVTIEVTPLPDALLTDSFICRGDSTILTMVGLQNIQITPITNLTWLDSVTALLKPDSTTTYTISGDACNGFFTTQKTLQVGRLGRINYTLSGAGVCQGGHIHLTVYGVTSVQITPFSGFFTYNGSTAELDLTRLTTTSYVLTAQSVCGGTATDSFTIPAVAFSDFSITGTTFCAGTGTFLTLYGLSNVTFTPDTGFVYIDSAWDSSHILMHPTVQTTYEIHATDCSGFPWYNTFTIRPIFPGVLSYQLNTDSNICRGDAMDVSIYGATNVQVTPTGSVTQTIPGQFDIIDYPDTTTTYYITGTSACGGNVSGSVTIYVQPGPSYTLSQQTVCPGDTVYLTLNDYQFTPFVYPDDGVTWIDATHLYIVPDSTSTYNISGTSNCGSYRLDSFAVNVAEPGILSYSVSDTMLCTGDTAVLTINGVSGISLNPSATLNYIDLYDAVAYLSPATNTHYTISGQSVCGGPVSASFNIYAGPHPVLTVSDSSICTGDSVYITVTPLTNIAITPAANLIWIDSSHIIATPQASTTYTITGSSPCTGHYFNLFSVSVGSATAHITANNTVICSSDSTQICANTGGTSYHWNTGQTTNCIYVNQGGNYYVTVTSNNACTAESNHIGISVYPVTAISITQNGDTLSVANGSSIQWYKDGVAIPNATGHTYVALEPGTYSVTVLDNNGCQVTSSLIQVGIKEISESSLSIYPNPLYTGAWQMDVSPALLGAQIQIVDDAGRGVYEAEINNLHTQIEINAANGIYLLRINNSNSQIVKKLVKMY